MFSYFGLKINVVILSVSAISLVVSLVEAGEPPVSFDVAPLVACQDVTSEEFRVMNPNEKLIEATFVISSYVGHDYEDQLVQYLIRIESKNRTLQVVDYLPKTTLESPLAGTRSIEKKVETNSILGINASGKYDHLITTNANASMGKKKTDTERYELVPELQLVAASGTIHRGSGVYFKLKPARQITLEGAKEFRTVLKVPIDWTADQIQIRCEALGTQSSPVPGFKSDKIYAQQLLSVVLYQAGDTEAKEFATRLIEESRELRQLSIQHRKAIEKATQPSTLDQFVSLITLKGPSLSSTKLSSSLSFTKKQFNRLPLSLQDAILQYQELKQEMVLRSGQAGNGEAF
ncbi:MAG: hypothetical protein COA78_20780 [Blastopirellula sp.]|nr:MAG: hypothetical protein COA78_20780 [Blastopirellula sp.]